MSALVRPEMRSEWYAFYRESYNFLKHADQDADGKLGVYDIVASNHLLLFMCIFHFGTLFGPYTQHMTAFIVYVGVLYPKLDCLPTNLKAQLRTATHGGLTRGELTSYIRVSMEQNADYQRERREDLSEVLVAQHFGVKEVQA